MIPAAFAYSRATSVSEALSLLVEHGSDAKLLAGGQSLLPLMKLRLARPERLIDIGRVAELRGVRELDGGGLSIGPLTTYAALLADERISRYGAMADALPRIGDVQVRNRGTIGGAIAHADPASDMPAVLLALDASVVVRSANRGERVISIDQFFHGAFQTAIAEDELLTEIRIPAASGSVGSAYRALEQPASGYAIAGVAVVVGTTGSGGSWDLVRIGVTGVDDHAYRATGAEAELAGSSGDDAPIERAAARVTEGANVNGDIHADPAYRAAMAQVMARRALELARSRLG
ncbi:MAG TPA: xanthine dehydrogenase family protein subunit M [Candidatus Binatia bacterium]|nr:xanthine dehydrogenase family protein subunit M [Candidatus Binatia bacterium]